MYSLECPVCGETLKVELNEELDCPSCSTKLYMDFSLNEDLDEVPGLFIDKQ